MKKAAAFVILLGALALLAVTPRGSVAVPFGIAAPQMAQSFAPYGELDCNGYSPIQQPLAPMRPCTDLSNYDNGHYIGHDEPEVQFFSSLPGSGNDLQWRVKLPVERPLPATQTFENEIAFWFGLVLCDEQSYPLNPCMPDSDANPSGPGNRHAAGSAFLEMQFYPPGLPRSPLSTSCDTTHWCAAMGDFSLLCNFAYTYCNKHCEEPANFAFIQRNGVPTGPPGPASATLKTFTPNSETLLMNQGDELVVTIKDTPAGMINAIQDLTTGQTGYMIASVANGFQHLGLKTCKPTPYAFHPEFDSAKSTNKLPWSIGIRNVAYAAEIGHFEKRDGDHDDKPCFPGPVLAGCEGSEIDYDGNSYLPDWPDGTSNAASSIQIESVPGNGFGPVSRVGGRYRGGFASMKFVTGVAASEHGCKYTGAGCSMPPPGAAFYPFYAYSKAGAACFLTLGNDIAGSTTGDFGGIQQWGTFDHNVPYTYQGNEFPNPCIPH